MLYGYVRQNAVKYLDPRGLYTDCECKYTGNFKVSVSPEPERPAAVAVCLLLLNIDNTTDDNNVNQCQCEQSCACDYGDWWYHGYSFSTRWIDAGDAVHISRNAEAYRESIADLGSAVGGKLGEHYGEMITGDSDTTSATFIKGLYEQLGAAAAKKYISDANKLRNTDADDQMLAQQTADYAGKCQRECASKNGEETSTIENGSCWSWVPRILQ